MTFQNLEVMTSNPGYSTATVANMSDLDEAQRWAEAHEQAFGVGEDLYDPDGARANAQLFGPRDD